MYPPIILFNRTRTCLLFWAQWTNAMSLETFLKYNTILKKRTTLIFCSSFELVERDMYEKLMYVIPGMNGCMSQKFVWTSKRMSPSTILVTCAELASNKFERRTTGFKKILALVAVPKFLIVASQIVPRTWTSGTFVWSRKFFNRNKWKISSLTKMKDGHGFVKFLFVPFLRRESSVLLRTYVKNTHT